MSVTEVVALHGIGLHEIGVGVSCSIDIPNLSISFLSRGLAEH